jgi:hypothetical protein
MSDEFNGVTKDHDGVVRPIVIRSFSSLSEARQVRNPGREQNMPVNLIAA